MKKKIALIITAAIMMVATIIGGTMAASKPEASVKHKVGTSDVDITVFPKDGINISGAVPGKPVDAVSTVKNIGSQSAYLRVAINKYWCNADDERNFDADAKQIEVHVNQEKWIVQDADKEYGELVYCYYREPLEVGGEAEVMNQVTVLKNAVENSNKYAGLKCHIDFDTDAVQITPGAVDTTKPNDALMAEWGIEVWLNEDQSINQVEEQ